MANVFSKNRGFGGVSYVYLHTSHDLPAAIKLLRGLKGVEKVLTRTEAAKQFNLMPSRIGDLVVPGDEHTVFGNLDTEYEALPAGYRSHGSLHEAIVRYLFIMHTAHPLLHFFPVIIKSLPGSGKNVSLRKDRYI